MKLPTIKKSNGNFTKEYISFMANLVKKLEKILPIKIYGFTYYSDIGYYWYTTAKDIKGNLILDRSPNRMPFDRAFNYVYPNEKIEKSGD